MDMCPFHSIDIYCVPTEYQVLSSAQFWPLGIGKTPCPLKHIPFIRKNPHNFLYLCALIWGTIITSLSVFPDHTRKETADYKHFQRQAGIWHSLVEADWEGDRETIKRVEFKIITT